MQRIVAVAVPKAVSRTVGHLTGARWFFQEIAISAVAYAARFALIRRLSARAEIHLLRKVLERTAAPGPAGEAMGYLFQNHDPGLSAKDIYRAVFSSERFQQGYQSQMGQDMFLNRWYFKNRGPGFFVDVGAFDGILGSNTYYFEKKLHWRGIAFEPNPSAFDVLRTTRSCQLIRACAYERDGQIPFLALSEKRVRKRSESPPLVSQLSMVFDSTHGGAMLSGIPEHMNQLQWVQSIRKPLRLNQTLTTAPCRRIDSVLKDFGVDVVDYLSVDVEGAELEVLRGIDFGRVQVNIVGVEHNDRFPQVYDLLTKSGFEYQGLLFFDEIFVHKNLRYSWDV
ncbi:FkbM family methyltransferase [Mycobacterium sp. SM1]|uniref:FkbM family methyltransferase n=1 Tax=Mycobacterium sp. SM1 TaxID=2816243 RepID=UPI001BCB5D16|nr:FkbM family methyltransferase [Mycobacterium sp. SM1]MBS4729543.1 FkbM family methyltransferase [Mycobacterium sp. SM1]